MSERWGDSRKDREALDRWLTTEPNQEEWGPEQILADGAMRFTVDGYSGIAWYAVEAEIEPDEDTEWTGIEEPTGLIVMTMVGDDRHFSFDPDEIHPLEDDHCPECGQIGCGHYANTEKE